MDLDLTIRDFRVQRSREKQTKVIKSDDFRDHMIDKKLWELQAYLVDGNERINEAALGVPPEAAPISRIVVLCGVKTRLITEIAFGDSIFNARLLGNVYRFFPDTTICLPRSVNAISLMSIFSMPRVTGPSKRM